MAHPSWDDIEDMPVVQPELQRDDPPPPKKTATMAPKPPSPRRREEPRRRRIPWAMIVIGVAVVIYLWANGYLSF